MSIKDKLLSRKLWVAIFGAVGGIIIAVGAPESIVNLIVGAATALVSIVIYIVTEGKVDAAAVEQSADLANQIIEIINALKNKEDTTK